MSFIQSLNDISTFINTNLGTGLFEKTKDLIGGIEPLIRAALGTYFLLCLLDYYRNGVQDNAIDMAKKFTGWIILTALVLNATHYLELAKLIYEAPDKFAAVFGANNAINPNIFQSIESNVTKINAKLSDLLDTLDFYDVYGMLLVWFGQAVVYVVVFILSSLSYVYYLMAKVTLAMVLVVGPLFLGGMFFPATRQYGMNWIGQCFNYIVSVMLYTILVVVMVNFLGNYVTSIATKDKYVLETVWQLIGGLIPMSILFVLALFSVPSISSALTGGATLELNARKGASLARGTGAAAGKTWGFAKGVGKWAGGKLGLGNNSIKAK